jgi:hypothetical protein
VLQQSRLDFLLRALIHAGPSYFAGMLLESGHGHLLRNSYGNFCHLCNDIFSDEGKASVVKNLFVQKLSGMVGPAVQASVSSVPRAEEASLRLLAD